MRSLSDFVKGQTPTLVLQVLSEEPMHGYQIAKAVLERSRGIFDLKEGTLYPILHQLDREGIVKARWETSDKGRKRKVYALTSQGKKILGEKTAAWKEFALGMSAVLGNP